MGVFHWLTGGEEARNRTFSPTRGHLLTYLDSVGMGLKYILYLICLTTLVTR